jgi:hypothetical protein
MIILGFTMILIGATLALIGPMPTHSYVTRENKIYSNQITEASIISLALIGPIAIGLLLIVAGAEIIS